MVQIEFDWLVQLANLRLDIIWKSHVWKSHSLLDYLIQLVHGTEQVLPTMIWYMVVVLEK